MIGKSAAHIIPNCSSARWPRATRSAPGAIILCHESLPTTIDALSEITKELKTKGYRFVTVSELVAMGIFLLVEYRREQGFRFIAPDGVEGGATRQLHKQASRGKTPRAGRRYQSVEPVWRQAPDSRD